MARNRDGIDPREHATTNQYSDREAQPEEGGG